MKRLFVAGILLSFSIFLLPAQSVRPFQVQWHKSFGGTNADYPYRIAVASNGGYMIAAVSDSSTGGNKQTTNYGGSDAWFVRTDSDGNKLWERNIGGTLRDRVRDLKWTCNGQWIAVGESASSPSGNKTSPVYGESDYWIVLLDDQGNTIWEKSYGGSSHDEAVAVSQVDAGEFVVVGYSYSGTNTIKTIASSGMADVWILRLSDQGNIVWQTNYGTAYQDWPYAMDRYGTNGFVIAANSPPGGMNINENWDFWIFAIDQNGHKLWERFYGGDGSDEPFDIRQTFDGGFITCGWTTSGVSGNKTTPLAGGSPDVWIVRLNSAGDKLWERTVGSQGTDVPHGLAQTIDGGFVIAGQTFGADALTVRLDANGNIVWEHAFDASYIGDIQNTEDGGLIAAGGTSEGYDVRVMKLAPDALTAPQLDLLHPGTASEPTKNILLRGIVGRSYVTEGTEDFVNWLPFATNTLSSNSVELLDQNAHSERRFYRARMVP